MERMLWRKLGETDEKKPLFQLFFLKDDEDQSVEVEELEEIDFTEVKRRLKMGESVFITAKHKQTPDSSLVKSQKDTPESLYFLHACMHGSSSRFAGAFSYRTSIDRSCFGKQK